MAHVCLIPHPLTLLFLFFLVISPEKSFVLAIVSVDTKEQNSVDIIKQTCTTCAAKSTIISYSFCLTSLQVIPVSHATNLQGLAGIAMELALKNATNTISSIVGLLSNASFDPFALACLGDCLELYSDGVVTLVDAIGALLTGQYSTANIWVSAVMEAATTCEEGLTMEGNVSPLTIENYNFFQLCDIALCIINWLSLHANT
ncbi:putative invertase inhibitor [Carica papaya]|uniref:putative invertase inhibitor n=1 Tax=Carica papaya TaxID=3649 RepID=UPI000B8C9A07|nr:putative invertase inhibitor [Carica papaya]